MHVERGHPIRVIIEKNETIEGSENTMTEPIRIPADETHRNVMSGQALLVCAYEDEDKFMRMHLQDAISLQEFKTRLPALSKDQEIIFY